MGEKGVKKKFTVDLGSAGVSKFKVDPSLDFDDWPREMQLVCINTILILYNIHLIPEKDFRAKYQKLIEKYKGELNELLDFLE